MPSERNKRVFLNVPYDKGFEPLFITLVASLVSLRFHPVCVFQIQETGEGRLKRIENMISSCRTSIHDLSRVGTPVRFNMPFELGLAYGIKMLRKNHDVVVLENIEHRLDKTLSDFRGIDPIIHNNNCDLLVSGILDAFSPRNNSPDVQKMRIIARLLKKSADLLKQRHHARLLYRASIYRDLVDAAIKIAIQEGLLSLT